MDADLHVDAHVELLGTSQLLRPSRLENMRTLPVHPRADPLSGSSHQISSYGSGNESAATEHVNQLRTLLPASLLLRPSRSADMRNLPER